MRRESGDPEGLAHPVEQHARVFVVTLGELPVCGEQAVFEKRQEVRRLRRNRHWTMAAQARR